MSVAGGRRSRVRALPEAGTRWVVWAALALPFLVAAVTLWGRHYQPVLDLAMTELRVRDVGTRRTPLVGLPGRIGTLPDQGSHPGPLSFYLLAPTYRALGSDGWALLVAAIALQLVAMGVALWVAGRRGGVAMVLAVAALLALVVRGYGFEVLVQPWNPYLPLLWWLVVLLAAWGVLVDDLPMVVVLAAAASLCAQTHLPYLGLGLGVGALCVAVPVVRAVRDPERRPRTARWLGAAGGVALVLWLPPVVDQLRREPGNLGMLVDYFRHSPEEPVGTGEGVRLLLRHLDVTRLGGALTGGDGFVTRAGFDLTGSVVPGLLVLAAWGGAVVLAVRARHTRLVALHAVVGWTLLLAVVSMSRIFGKVWYYLTLWMWLTTALLVVATVWSVVVWARERAPMVPRLAAALVAVVGIGSWLALVVEAGGARAPEQHLSDTLRVLVAPTERALERGSGDAVGRDGTYVVTWSDAGNFGSQAWGLALALERDGFDVGMTPYRRVAITPWRVVEPADADAEVRLATGRYIDEVAALPGAVEVVRHDPRSAWDKIEYRRLGEEVTERLREEGLGRLVPMLGTNLFGLQIEPGVPADVQRRVDRMLHLGMPTAVFLLPPGSPG